MHVLTLCIVGAVLAVLGLALWESLATERIVAILRAVQQEDDRDGARLFDSWVPAVEAQDGEVMARVTGDVIAADIIELDQKARVITPEPVTLHKSVIPKLKHGLMVTEAMQDSLNRINAGIATGRDRNVFDNWVGMQTRRLLNGIRDRRELLLAGMMIDDFDYDRFGIIMANVSWGMPSALKITPTAWSTTASATPIADILGTAQTAEDDYGEAYDTVVMPRSAFDEMTLTDEFKAKAQLYQQITFPAGSFPSDVREINQMLAGRLLNGMNIILYNKRTQIEGADSALTATRFLPDADVILADSADFGNAQTWDFANALVLETMPGAVPAMIGSMPGGEQSGPIAYATAGDPHGNPPGQILWACQRGFPRKHRLTANAVIHS